MRGITMQRRDFRQNTLFLTNIQREMWKMRIDKMKSSRIMSILEESLTRNAKSSILLQIFLIKKQELRIFMEKSCKFKVGTDY